MSETGAYYGKYQGTVTNNVDPMRLGRLLVSVPDVLSFVPSTWAVACVPLAGPPGPPMGVYMVPPIGAGVWVEFEHGDPNKPIWVGCRWGVQTDIPFAAQAGIPADPNIVIQSLLQNAIIISDAPPVPPPMVQPPVAPPVGGITLRSASGAAIVVNDAGIFISNGKGATITMVLKQIDFNLGALTILT